MSCRVVPRREVTFQPAAAGKFEFALAATVRTVGSDGAPFELSAAESALLEVRLDDVFFLHVSRIASLSRRGDASSSSGLSTRGASARSARWRRPHARGAD